MESQKCFKLNAIDSMRVFSLTNLHCPDIV